VGPLPHTSKRGKTGRYTPLETVVKGIQGKREGNGEEPPEGKKTEKDQSEIQ